MTKEPTELVELSEVKKAYEHGFRQGLERAAMIAEQRGEAWDSERRRDHGMAGLHAEGMADGTRLIAAAIRAAKE